MGQKLLQKLLPGLQKVPLPPTTEATPQGLQAYTIGMETVDTYKGDPKTLVDALGTFRSGKSRPFLCAGIAYILVTASREKDGSYVEAGLDMAMDWLEKAQETEPDILLINMIEAFVYIYNGRFDDARLILDYLHEQEKDNYHINLAEMTLEIEQGDVEKAGLWYEKTVRSAINAPQRLRLQARMGDFYLKHSAFDKALVMFKEAAHFDKENPALWHKISLAFFRQENLEEAQQVNQRVLRLKKDYPPALQLAEAIKQKLEPEGGKKRRRLFGR